MPAGRLTRDQLLRAWIDAVDPDHARGVLADPDSAAAIEQACEQLALISAACDETTQEMYLLAGSGQSAAPAGGASRSAVTLTLTRTLRLGELLVIEPGRLIEEVAQDAGEVGAVEVRTGRRYALQERVVFFPGESGPVEVQARAERPGRGFDWPGPASLRGLVQPGAGLANDEASVVPGIFAPHRLVSAPRPDAPIPEHVGQIVELTLGSNAGRRLRVVGYGRQKPPADAGSLLLARDILAKISGLSGDFLPGEAVHVEGSSEGTEAIALAVRAPWILLEVRTGQIVAPPQLVTGIASGAMATIESVEIAETLTVEAGTAAWRVLDLALEYGLSSTNERAPEGGRDAVLDSLAYERGAHRAPEETDEQLRDRASDPSDAVTPMAVLRAANRALAPYAAEATLREAGTPSFPGFYADIDALDLDGVAVLPSLAGFQSGERVHQDSSGAVGVAITQSPTGLGALGTPVLVGLARVRGTFVSGSIIRGEKSGATVAVPVFSGGLRLEDEHRVLFSYADMRAFFYVGTFVVGVGDFGFALDAHPYGFCDASPALSFLDGFAVTSAAAAQKVWQAVDEVRPAASGFALIQEDGAPL